MYNRDLMKKAEAATKKAGKAAAEFFHFAEVITLRRAAGSVEITKEDDAELARLEKHAAETLAAANDAMDKVKSQL